MFYRIWLFVIVVLFPATSWSQSATVNASPSPCILANSSANCSSSITWSTSNAPGAGLFFGSTLVQGAPGTYEPNWININGYRFDVRQNLNDPNSQVLAFVIVSGVVPGGSVSAMPNPCTIAAGSSTCMSSITWTSTYAPSAGLFFGSTLVSGTPGIPYQPTWINAGGYIFNLRADYNDPNSQILASVNVIGQTDPLSPSATISAMPNSCNLATAASTCTSTISWNSTYAPNAGLFLGSGLVGNAISGSYPANTIGVNPQTFYVRMDRNNANSQILASLPVSGTVVPAPANLQAQCSVDGTSVNLTWLAVASATAYAPRLNSVGNDQTATTFTSTIVPGQQYGFTVQALINGSYGNLSSITFTCSAPPPSTPGNLISNGGFESPATSQYVYPSTIPGWMISGSVAVQHNGSGWGASAAPEGVQTVVLQGVGTITATVNAPATGSYNLTFKAAARTNWGGPQTIAVKVNGTTVYSLSPPNGTFVQYQTTLNLSVGGQTITFAGTNGSGDNSAFVDEVVLAAITPPPTVVDLRSYFPATTNTYRTDSGIAHGMYKFFLVNQVASDPFWSLYTQLLDLRKSSGQLLIWQKIYASDTNNPENLNCTATYGHLFLGGGSDKSVVEVGDWLNNNGIVNGAGGACPNNYRAFGYQKTASFVLPATGINWSGVNGLDSSYSSFQMGYVFGQNPPSTNYIYGGYTEYSSPTVVQFLSSWSPLYGRNLSSGNWGVPGKSYANVVRMVLYHGTSDGTNTTACGGFDSNNPLAGLYIHMAGYKSYAIELYMDQSHGILQETLLYDETGYFGYPPCSTSFPVLSPNGNLNSALHLWRAYID